MRIQRPQRGRAALARRVFVLVSRRVARRGVRASAEAPWV
jgi:hypothetical protein